MRNRYCTNCGSPISPQLENCESCHTVVREMKLSDGQKEFVEAIEEYNADNPPSKVKGCFATLLVFGIIFGIPGTLAFTGTEIDSLLGVTITSIVLLGVNILLYKYRKKMNYNHKRYYTLSEKPKNFFRGQESACRKCNQPLEGDMTYCPNCGVHIHEDLPIDLSQKRENHYCVDCGKDITDKKFCPECGKKVEVM